MPISSVTGIRAKKASTNRMSATSPEGRERYALRKTVAMASNANDMSKAKQATAISSAP